MYVFLIFFLSNPSEPFGFSSLFKEGQFILL